LPVSQTGVVRPFHLHLPPHTRSSTPVGFLWVLNCWQTQTHPPPPPHTHSVTSHVTYASSLPPPALPPTAHTYTPHPHRQTRHASARAPLPQNTTSLLNTTTLSRTPQVPHTPQPSHSHPHTHTGRLGANERGPAGIRVVRGQARTLILGKVSKCAQPSSHHLRPFSAVCLTSIPLFMCSKLAYAAALGLLGCWVLFRVVLPAIGLYSLSGDSPLTTL
jgi:hypothetical protein